MIMEDNRFFRAERRLESTRDDVAELACILKERTARMLRIYERFEDRDNMDWPLLK